MSTPIFHATCVVVVDDETGWTVGFADREIETRQYLQIQRAHVLDEQDRALGLGTYYIEADDQSRSCYGGIGKIDLSHNSVRLELNDKSAQSLGLDKTVLITFDADQQTLERLRQGLEAVFSGAGTFDQSIGE